MNLQKFLARVLCLIALFLAGVLATHVVRPNGARLLALRIAGLGYRCVEAVLPPSSHPPASRIPYTFADPALSFRAENPNHPAVVEFRNRLDAAGIPAAADPFAIADHVRGLCEHGEDSKLPKGDDPNAYLTHALTGRPMTCRYFSLLHVAACAARGYSARMLSLSHDGRRFSHAVSEVFLPRYGRWVVIDTDFNIAYQRRGVWLNAWELHKTWIELRAKTKGLPPLSHSDAYRLMTELGVEVTPLGEAGSKLRRTNLSPLGNLHLYDSVVFAQRSDYLSATYPWAHPCRVQQFIVTSPAYKRDYLCPEAEFAAFDELYWSPRVVVGR